METKENREMKDSKEIKWKDGDVATYRNRNYDVVLYDGIFPDRKGQLKFMERADMFHAKDFWLNDLSKSERRKIKKLK